jgi:hypothetical protein
MDLLKQVCTDIFGIPKDIQFFIEDAVEDRHRKKKTDHNQLKQKALRHPLVADAIEIFNGTLIDVKIS